MLRTRPGNSPSRCALSTAGWRGFDSAGIAGPVEQSKRPRRLRVKVPAWADCVIIAIRLHTYWNSKRIAAEMSWRQIYVVSPDHIDQLFRSAGCSRGTVPRPPGDRYERGRPNELWHVDIKGPFFIRLRAGATSRPGSWVWSTITLASWSGFALRPRVSATSRWVAAPHCNSDRSSRIPGFPTYTTPAPGPAQMKSGRRLLTGWPGPNAKPEAPTCSVGWAS